MEVDIDGDKKTITDGVSNDRARIVNIYITCLSASFKVQYNSSWLLLWMKIFLF
jgi:hypothetical protein